MRIGGSLFLLAIGAILTFAVTANSSLVGGMSVNWDTVGVILMVIGAVGLLWSLMTLNAYRDRNTVVEDNRVVDAPVVERERFVQR